MKDLNLSICPICSQNAWRKDIIASSILLLPQKYNIWVCTNCGQRNLHPELTPSELDDLYSGAYFGGHEKVSSETIADIEVAATDYVSDLAVARHEKYAKSIQKMKELHPTAKTLLDVGAATGDFVKIAQEKGLNAQGIEYSQFAIELAEKMHGIKLQNLELSEVKSNNYFDIIHLNHVFEHFNRPIKELGHIHRLLSENGLLYIEIPYQFHFIEKLNFKFGKSNPGFTLHSLHHPYFYTPMTISKILKLNGFEIIKLSVFDEARYTGNGIKGRIKKQLWRVLSGFSIGNHIEIYAKKC